MSRNEGAHIKSENDSPVGAFRTLPSNPQSVIFETTQVPLVFGSYVQLHETWALFDPKRIGTGGLSLLFKISEPLGVCVDWDVQE